MKKGSGEPQKLSKIAPPSVPPPEALYDTVVLQRNRRKIVSAVDKRVVFQKGGFGRCSPGTKTGTRVHSDVPPEQKLERG